MSIVRTSAAIFIVATLAPVPALGFCRTTTCQVTPTPDNCRGTVDDNGCSNEGLPLRWPSPCLSFSVNQAGSPRGGISSAELETQVRAAFDTWSAVTCNGGGSPNFFVMTYPQVACDEVGYRSDGPNQNLWVFRDANWEHETSADGALALTTLSVVAETGEIYDADVELNSRDAAFSLHDAEVETDLLSIVLHESGHVLGIGHSQWSTSTMATGYLTGSTEMRSIEADDNNAICAAMPPGELPKHCDPEPRHGFSTECQYGNSGCSCVIRGREASSQVSWTTLFALLLVARRRPRVRHSAVGPGQLG